MITQLQTGAGAYHRDVATIAGTSFGDLVKSRKIIDLYRSQGRLSNMKVLWDSAMGRTIDTNAPADTFSKAFSADALRNNLTQTTKALQPFRNGQIQGVGEKLYNGNRDDNYLTHADIPFTSSQPWTVSIMLNFNGTNEPFCFAIGRRESGANGIMFKANEAHRFVINDTGYRYGDPAKINSLFGKTTLITFVAKGDNSVMIYKNGIFSETIVASTEFTFNNLFNAYATPIYLLNGSVCHYSIESGAVSAADILSEATLLSSYYPEIPSVTIGSQTWAIDNFMAVVTPTGTIIPEVQNSTNTVLLTEGTLNFTNWRAIEGATIIDANSFSANINTGILKDVGMESGKIYKITIAGTVTGANLSVRDAYSGINKIILSGTFDTVLYYKNSIAQNIFFQADGGNIADCTITKLQVELCSWNEATTIYDSFYAATSGTVAQKTYAAVKAAAMWCSCDNDPTNDAIYGKLYNGYAKNLLYADMVTAAFGWNVSTKAALTTLAANGGNALKLAGSTHWNTAAGTNTTNFCALGGAMRNADGTFATLKNTATFWAADVVEALTLTHDADTATIAASNIKAGHSIRLIKN